MIIIDRFEGNFAVCEADGFMKDIPLKQIADGSAEGDVLIFENGIYKTDRDATEQRKKRAEALFGMLKKGSGNDE